MRLDTACATVLALALAGCAGDGHVAANVDASATIAPSRTAAVRLLLTDAPATYDHVYVDLDSIALHAAGTADTPDGGSDDDGGVADGWTTIAVPHQRVDLLTLRNGATLDLGGATIAAGGYNQLRLIVSGGAVTVAGSDAPLTIPSGAETGVKLAIDETFAADSSSTLTLDFDAAASVVDAHGTYLLKPVLHLARN